MKKSKLRTLPLILALLLIFLCACGEQAAVVYDMGPSELYSQRQVRAAMEKAERSFEMGLGSQGCVLLGVSYDEENTLREITGRMGNQYGDKDVIVVTIDFRVNEEGGPITLEPGQTYTNYKYTMTRNFFGQWVVENAGYA